MNVPSERGTKRAYPAASLEQLPAAKRVALDVAPSLETLTVMPKELRVQVLEELLHDPRSLMRQCATDAATLRICRTELVPVRQGRWRYRSTPWGYVQSLRRDRDPLHCLLREWFLQHPNNYRPAMDWSRVGRNDLLLWATSRIRDELRANVVLRDMLASGTETYFFSEIMRSYPKALLSTPAFKLAKYDAPILPVGDAAGSVFNNTPMFFLGRSNAWLDLPHPNPADLIMQGDVDAAARQTRQREFVELINNEFRLPVCDATQSDGRIVQLRFLDVFSADLYVRPTYMDARRVSTFDLWTTGVRFDPSLVNRLGVDYWPPQLPEHDEEDYGDEGGYDDQYSEEDTEEP